MQRTRWLVVSVLLLVGAVWVAQGLGLLGTTSFMEGQPVWAVIGAAMIAAGVGLGALSLRRRGA
jgi:hypothetical protein